MSMEPSICETVKTGNPRLQFLLDCFRYNPVERPAATFISRGLQQCVLESTAGYILTRLKDMRTAASSFSVQREGRSPQSQISSFLFPGRRIVNSARSRKFDPLMRQQIEGNVKQVSEIHFIEQNFSLLNCCFLFERTRDAKSEPSCSPFAITWVKISRVSR